LRSRAEVFFLLENFEKALEYFLKSFEIRKKNNDKEYLANSLNNIGGIYQKLEQFEKSIEVTEKALKLYTSINNEIGISTSLNNLGTAYNRMGKYDKALEFAQNMKWKGLSPIVYFVSELYEKGVSLTKEGATRFLRNLS